MPSRLFLLLCFVACCWLVQVSSAQQPDLPAGSRFVMSHFKNDGGGGDERLYISVSPDGLQWTALNGGNPVWQPDGWHGFGNVVRDPTIIYHEGFYWVAYTSGNYGNHESVGLVKSQDLVNWTFVGEISVLLPGATDQLTWSPVFFRDGEGSVHLFVNISPTGGSSYTPVGMKTYETHPVNATWTAWSTPQLIALPGGNSNELFVWKEGDTYHGMYVDFTSGSGWIKVSSTHLTQGWGDARWLGMNAFEGGMMLKKPDGTGYRFFLEAGNGKSPPSGTYLWSDLDPEFQPLTPFVSVQSTIGMRNGKMTALHGTTSFADWKAQALAGRTVAEQEPLADPDFDGLPNVLEALSNFDPLSPGRLRFPLLLPAGSGLIFPRAPWLKGALTPEGSTNLIDWSTSGLEVKSVTLLTNGSEEVHLKDAVSGSTSRFFRLRGTIPQAVPIEASYSESAATLSPQSVTPSAFRTTTSLKHTPRRTLGRSKIQAVRRR